MVGNIGRIPNPALRLSGYLGGRPLQERCAEAVSLAMREIPPGAPERDGLQSQMTSEFLIDDCHDRVRKYRERTTQSRDPRLQQAYDELLSLQRAINGRVTALNEAQRQWLWRARTSWEHAVIGSLHEDMASALTREDLEWPEAWYPTVPDVKRVIEEKRKKLQQVSNICGAIGNAQGYDQLPEENSRAFNLCHGLYDLLRSALARIEALEGKSKSKQKVA